MTTKISTADLYDEHGESLQVCAPIFRDFGGLDSFTGPIKILKAFENFQMTRSTLETDGKGHVLVIDGGGSMRRALLGDMIGAKALANGWAGFVIYGAIRDVDELGAMDLGVQALATHPMKTEKKGIGDLDVPVTFAGVTIHPGDFVACDNNGIVVSPVALEV